MTLSKKPKTPKNIILLHLLLVVILFLTTPSKASYSGVPGDSSSPVIGSLSCAFLNSPHHFMTISSTTVAVYSFPPLLSSLVYSTAISGGQGKSVTSLNRTNWFIVTTGDSKMIFYDKLTPAIVKTWTISSPSDFLEIDSFIENDYFVTSDANQVLAYWDRTQSASTSPIVGKSEVSGIPTLVLALQNEGYFAAKIDSSIINFYEVNSISISNFHQITVPAPSSITSISRMGSTDYIIYCFDNKIRVFDWYTKQVIFKDEYTHTNTIHSLHNIGDADDRFFITDIEMGNRRMLVLEKPGILIFEKKTIGLLTDPVCASEDGYMLGTATSADENDFIKFNGPCDPSCATCFGEKPTHCKSCDGNRMHHSLTNECYVSGCETETIFGTNRCKACDSRCATCNFFDYKICESCHPNFPHLFNNFCHECPSGEIMESGSCVPCQSGCASCESSSSFCLTCLPDLKFHQNTCQANCPSGFFDLSCTCVQCTAPCTSCQTSATTCTGCQPPNKLHNSQCVASCPLKFFDDGTGVCQPCNSECENCLENADQCSSCQGPKLLENGSCVDTCQSNFEDNGNGVCIEQEKVNEEIDFLLKQENFEEKIRTRMYIQVSFYKGEEDFQVDDIVQDSFQTSFELFRTKEENNNDIKDTEFEAIKINEILREKSDLSSNSVSFVLESQIQLEDITYILEGTLKNIKSKKEPTTVLLGQKMKTLLIKNEPSAEFTFYENTGKLTGSVNNPAATLTQATMYPLLALSSEVAFPILKFIQIIKISEKLEFINIDFGAKQQAFLSALGLSERGKFSIVAPREDSTMNPKFGKLTNIYEHFTIFDDFRVIFTIFVFLLRIPIKLFRMILKRYKRVSWGFTILAYIVQYQPYLEFIAYNSFLLDGCFYTTIVILSATQGKKEVKMYQLVPAIISLAIVVYMTLEILIECTNPVFNPNLDPFLRIVKRVSKKQQNKVTDFRAELRLMREEENKIKNESKQKKKNQIGIFGISEKNKIEKQQKAARLYNIERTVSTLKLNKCLIMYSVSDLNLTSFDKNAAKTLKKNTKNSESLNKKRTPLPYYIRLTAFLFVFRMLVFQCSIAASQTLPIISVFSMTMTELVCFIVHFLCISRGQRTARKIMMVSKLVHGVCMLIFCILTFTLCMRGDQAITPVSSLRQNIGIYSVLFSLYFEYLIVVVLTIQTVWDTVSLYLRSYKMRIRVLDVLQKNNIREKYRQMELQKVKNLRKNQKRNTKFRARTVLKSRKGTHLFNKRAGIGGLKSSQMFTDSPLVLTRPDETSNIASFKNLNDHNHNPNQIEMQENDEMGGNERRRGINFVKKGRRFTKGGTFKHGTMVKSRVSLAQYSKSKRDISRRFIPKPNMLNMNMDR